MWSLAVISHHNTSLPIDPVSSLFPPCFQDATVRIWDTKLCQCKLVLSSHLQSVTCVKWGGSDLLYTASQDRTLKVWRADDVSNWEVNVLAAFDWLAVLTYGSYEFIHKVS